MAPINGIENFGSRRVLFAVLTTLLLALFVFQLVYHALRTSSTFDEAIHTPAGYRYLQCGDFGVNPEHPPLLKLIAAMPIYFSSEIRPPADCGVKFYPPRSQKDGQEWFTAAETRAEKIIVSARLAAASFSLLLAALVFLATREMFGRWEAVTALALLAFEPNLIAHGSLVTTDMALTATYFASFYVLYRYLRSPSVLRFLIVGLAVGAALASKHSGVLVLPAMFLFLMVDLLISRQNKIKDTWANQLKTYASVFAGAVLIGVTLLWASYGFRYNAVPKAGEALPIAQRFENTPPEIANSVKAQMVKALSDYHVLPESYLYGLADIISISSGERGTFLLGHSYFTGRWFYFPVAFIIKTSIPLLAMLFVGLFAFGLYRERGRELLILLLPALFFFAISLTSGLNIGVRHILPVYPFFIVVAAAGACYYARKYRLAFYLVILLLTYHAVTAFRTAPAYLAFSNDLWGGTPNTWRLLDDSNVEWGQNLKLVDEYVKSHNIQECWIAAFGTGYLVPRYQPCHTMPAFLWFRNDPPLEATPPVIEGTVFISTSVLPPHAPPFLLKDEYATFLNAQPLDEIGGSIFVYRGRFELPGVSAVSHIGRAMMLGPDRRDEALAELRQAVSLAPNNSLAHQMLGSLLVDIGQRDEARTELETVIRLEEGHPDPFIRDAAQRELKKLE
jgi:4-amino-4-deoxy-L-arabinose transferase-like glycosyltransferase